MLRSKKILSTLLIATMLLSSVAGNAAEFIKKGQSKDFTEDSYVISPAEARRAAENIKKLEELQQQVAAYKELVASKDTQIKIQEAQLKLAEQESELFKQMYADAHASYEKEKTRNDVFYRQPLFWILVGAAATGAAMYGGSQLTK